MFTGYPWNPLGVVWVAVPGVAQLAAWIGTYALSGVTIAIGGALYLAGLRRFRPLAGVTLAFGALALFLHPRTLDADPSRPHVRVVQPNIGQEGVGALDDPAQRRAGPSPPADRLARGDGELLCRG
jgi:apolipoprotein N-acyltransferase